MRKVRLFFRQAWGAFFLLLGVVMLIAGLVDTIILQYWDAPELPQRALLMYHTTRVLAQTVGVLGGILLAVLGFQVVTDNR